MKRVKRKRAEINEADKTILITGGTSGIGQELAKQMLGRGNTVLVNNVGIMRNLNLDQQRDLYDVTREIETSLSGPVRMVQQFLPHLKTRPAALIVNVSSGLAFIPLPLSPVYCVTRAAIHSFSLSLRAQLAGTSVTVINQRDGH